MGGWGTTEGPAGMQLADGVISTMGGAVHPYRLVTGILSRLLKTYSSFWVYTHTPYLSIHDNVVHTPRSDIHTKHVHTTNGWTSRLLAPMRENIVSMRDHMTAQRAGTGLDDGWLRKLHAEFMFGVTLRRWLFCLPMCWMPDASPLIRMQIQLVPRLCVLQEHTCNAVMLHCHGYAESSSFRPTTVLPWINSSDAGITDIHFD
ncbi:hypothetical protein EV421DRAFT_1815331 [Armillaria borealis]|uniref:Uncharacterized protein n=1 Tax=Armillaria borealis TaxID=47425 RepID=A0AA39JFI0_9AGAR|nr:hypothetical protein EV421DRAFT_1815331 [Armillaria borealis]